MAKLTLNISSNIPTQAIVKASLQTSPKQTLTKFLDVVGATVQESADCLVTLPVGDDVAASGTITLTNASISDSDTITIGGFVLTAKSSGATTNQFNIGGSATITAASVALAWNTYADTSVIYAKSAAGVVTFVATKTGKHGNYFALATSNGTGFGVSASAFAGGTNDSAVAKSYKSF